MEARCAEMRQRLEVLEDRLQVLSHQLEVEAGSANRQLVFFGLEKSSGIFSNFHGQKVEPFAKTF